MKELSIQSDDVRYQIRTLVLDGKNYKEIQEILGIPEGTWNTWQYRDTNSFRGFLLDCHDERLRRIARKNIDEIISMSDRDDDVRYLKIKSDMSAFVSERLEKDRFGKGQEDKDERTPINIAVNTYKRIENYKKGLPKPKEA
jgi:hypothetical protein